MISEIKKDSEAKMKRTIEALVDAFKKIRTGRATPAILDGITVDYYGTETPIAQVGNIVVEDARSLAINPWEKHLIPAIEKAIYKSDLGLNPTTSGDTIRIPMPPLTEETRKDYIRQARGEAEKSRISVRNVRRDANTSIKGLAKDKDISEDEERSAEEMIQKLTDSYIQEIDELLDTKEQDLMQV